MVLRSRDGGKTWSVQNNNDSSVFALHQGGMVAWSEWVKQDISSHRRMMAYLAGIKSGTNANLLGVSSSGKTFAVVGVRAVLRSENGGRSWKAVSNRDTERRWYQGIAGVSPDSDGRKFVAAGQFGQIVNF